MMESASLDVIIKVTTMYVLVLQLKKLNNKFKKKQGLVFVSALCYTVRRPPL